MQIFNFCVWKIWISTWRTRCSYLSSSHNKMVKFAHGFHSFFKLLGKCYIFLVKLETFYDVKGLSKLVGCPYSSLENFFSCNEDLETIGADVIVQRLARGFRGNTMYVRDNRSEGSPWISSAGTEFHSRWCPHLHHEMGMGAVRNERNNETRVECGIHAETHEHERYSENAASKPFCLHRTWNLTCAT